MQVVYKYELWQQVTNLPLPKGAKILSAIEQNGMVRLYALVDTNTSLLENYTVLAVGTGNGLPDDISTYQFVDTVSLTNGLLVFHVFYRKA